MKRIEIIANHSVEDDIIELIDKAGINSYTRIPVVYGTGNSNPKMGSPVWPEDNFMLIIYTEEQDAAKLKELIFILKAEFKDEGIKYFEINC